MAFPVALKRIRFLVPLCVLIFVFDFLALVAMVLSAFCPLVASVERLADRSQTSSTRSRLQFAVETLSELDFWKLRRIQYAADRGKWEVTQATTLTGSKWAHPEICALQWTTSVALEVQIEEFDRLPVGVFTVFSPPTVPLTDQQFQPPIDLLL